MGVDAMLTRLADKFYMTRGERAYGLGYVVVILLTAIVTIAMMAGLEAPYTLELAPTTFVYWVGISGAISGGVALYFARGWMGNTGMLGIARAVVGSIAVAIIAAIIAGTLTVPFAGTIYAPLVLVSAFLAKPWLAAIWFAGMFGAHYLMLYLEEERAFGVGRSAGRRATEQLSALSRANLYHRD